MITLTLKHKTIHYNGELLSVAKTLVIKNLFFNYFKSNNQLILSEQVRKVVTKLHSSDKKAILSLDTYRKEQQEIITNYFPCISSNELKTGNFNNIKLTNILWQRY